MSSHHPSLAPQSIDSIAAQLSIPSSHYVQHGDGVAKLRAGHAFVPEKSPLPGKLVLVSAITPTPAGEGKTTISIGLSDGLRRRGVRVVAALRQPSLGPTLGNKGGGAGGGRARLEPFDRVNLGLTGDIHAVTTAHNLLASLCDNSIHFGDSALDPRHIDFPRVVDLDDRALRHVISGLGGPLHGTAREGRFDITAASEVMAVLCLARDYHDLKRRLGGIWVGSARDGAPVTAAALNAVGGMAVVLREAMLPNLVQTAEGTAALVHGGPFGNIAHGCSSIVSTRYGLKHADVVVTEAGFGFDLGAEKFLNIKCRMAGVWPDAVVIVATLRALKAHGGAHLAAVSDKNLEALALGFGNLRHQIKSARAFGLQPIIAINLFPGDTEEELRALEGFIAAEGCSFARASVYTDGASGGLALADVVTAALASAPKHRAAQFLYDLDDSIVSKIEKVAKTVYGATAIEFSPRAHRDIQRAELHGLGKAPVCMAKTHLSLTADPKASGRPQPHVLPIHSVRVSAGAGFVVPLCGDIMTMPGLGRRPAVLGMDLDEHGNIVGLK